MSQTEDYYAVLEVGRDADAAEIKKSFRRLALAYHPDRCDEPEAEVRFKLINEAYATLSDPEKRRRYDRYGQSDSVTDPFQGGVNAHDLRDVFGDEIFNNLFASLFGARPTPSAPSHVEARLVITLDEVLKGGDHEVSIKRQSQCSACRGEGGSRACSRCQGRGQTQVRQGFLVLPRACPDCQGTGCDPRSSCRPCSGKGVKLQTATARVKIPQGIGHGQRLRVRGAGHVAPSGATGDLIVEVQVSAHEVFTPQGRDLIATVDVDYELLALGGECVVPLLEGGEAKVKVPPGFQPGKALRLRGKGLIERGESRRGDLLVYLEVTVPKVLTATERELLVALRAARHEAHLAEESSGSTDHDSSQSKQSAAPNLREGGSDSPAVSRLINRLRGWISNER